MGISAPSGGASASTVEIQFGSTNEAVGLEQSDAEFGVRSLNTWTASFRDLSGTAIQDDVFARLLTFPNVVVTGHQAFFTEDALAAIARTLPVRVERGQGAASGAHSATRLVKA